MKKPKKNIRYVATVRGVIGSVVDDNTTCKIIDALELYGRRHCTKGGVPAMILDPKVNEFFFESVQKIE